MDEIIREAKIQVERLKIEENAVFVFRLKDSYRPENLAGIRKGLREWIENIDVKLNILIIDNDVDMKYLSEAQMKDYGWVRVKED